MKRVLTRWIMLGASVAIVACGAEQGADEQAGDSTAPDTVIEVQAQSLSDNGQASTIEVLIDGESISTGPIAVGTDSQKTYTFKTSRRLATNSVVDLVVNNGHQSGAALSVLSVTAGALNLAPSAAYLDVGIKEAAFDGEDVEPGNSMVTRSGALRFLVGATSSSRESQTGKGETQWCTGKPNHNLDAAKQSFRAECGQSYDDQLGHKCDYKSDGFHCNGMVATAGAPDKPDDTAGNTDDTQPLRPGMVYCYGQYEPNTAWAKNSVPANCGVSYQSIEGHQCEWSARGWRCGGQVPKEKIPVHPFSTLCERYGTFLEVRAPKEVVVSRIKDDQMLVQWKAQDCENRNFHVWQNGVRIARSHPNSYLIRRVPIKQSVSFEVSTWEYLHRNYYTHESPRTDPVVFEITDALKNCQPLGSGKRYRCNSSLASGKSTKEPTMIAVPTDLGMQVLATSPVDSQGLCTLHLPGGSDESVQSGLVGWQIEAANDSCRKGIKGCGGTDGSPSDPPAKPDQPPPPSWEDWECKGQKNHLGKCI